MSDVKMTIREARSPRERLMLIVLGVVAVAALAYFLFLRPSGDEGVPAARPRPQPTATASASPTASPTAQPSAVPTPSPSESPPRFTIDTVQGRDPFLPLIVPDTAPTGEPTPGATTSPSPGGSPSPTTSPTGGGGSSAARRVTLLAIATESGQREARVRVDDSEYVVAQGETFATNFRVVELTERCGTFVHGDERFTLCVGEQVLK